MAKDTISLLLRSQDHIDIIADAVKDRQELVKKQIQELQRELNNLEDLLGQIYPAQTAIKEFTGTNTLNGYNPEWSISNKAEYVLQKSIEPLTTAEIADTIVNQYEKTADRKQIVRNLSVVFITQKNRFKRTKNAKGQNVYMV